MAQGMGNILTIGLVGVGAYFLYEWWQSQSATTTPVTTTPGTTTTMNQSGGQTSVSTAPPSTPALLTAVAANMTSKLAGVTSASADQWDSAFSSIFGQNIDVKYGLDFDSVYGTPDHRSNVTMTAMDFLQQAAVAKGGLPGLSGLGAFVRYPGLPARTMGSMVYARHHPLPHGITNELRRFRGLGAYTAPTGFESALFAGRGLSRNKLIF